MSRWMKSACMATSTCLKAQTESNFKWTTPSGKIEIYSEIARKTGFRSCASLAGTAPAKFRRVLPLTGKVGQHTQFGTQNNVLLHKYEDVPRLWMSPDAAASLGLKDWDMVEVTSPVGSVKVALQVTQAIRSDCVYLTPGFGHLSKGLRTAYGVGASNSVLHVTFVDPISGGQALSQTFVSVKKA